MIEGSIVPSKVKKSSAVGMWACIVVTIIVGIAGTYLYIEKMANAAFNPKTFPVEKILTASAEEYCKSTGKILSDFKLVGVHGDSIEDFFANLPRNTEVIVSYNAAAVNRDEFFGTALVPKEKK